MTTDERLISLAAADLISGITGVDPIFHEDETDDVTLPCTVLSARFRQEEEGSGLARQYDLRIERRYIRDQTDLDTEEDIYRQIGEALCPPLEIGMVTPPQSITINFDYYRIEKQTDSVDTEGETALRSRVWSVFARPYFSSNSQQPPPPPEGDTLGIFYLVPSYQTSPPAANLGCDNPYIQGRLLRQTWERINPSGSGNDLSWLGDAVEASESAGLISSFQITPDIHSPQWFFDAHPGETLNLTAPSAMPTTVPWGAAFQSEWQSVNEDMAALFDGRLGYILIQGVGRASESFLVDATDEAAANALAISNGYTSLDEAWRDGVQTLVDMMAAVWVDTPIILGAGIPYPTGGKQALSDMFIYGNDPDNYRGRFGCRPNNLSSRGPQPTDPSVGWLQMTAPYCFATGFQAANEQHGNDPAPPTRLSAMLAKGIGYLGSTAASPRGFIECFAGDLVADGATVLAAASHELTGA